MLKPKLPPIYRYIFSLNIIQPHNPGMRSQVVERQKWKWFAYQSEELGGPLDQKVGISNGWNHTSELSAGERVQRKIPSQPWCKPSCVTFLAVTRITGLSLSLVQPVISHRGIPVWNWKPLLSPFTFPHRTNTVNTSLANESQTLTGSEKMPKYVFLPTGLSLTQQEWQQTLFVWVQHLVNCLVNSDLFVF